jgi:hypothetical protein
MDYEFEQALEEMGLVALAQEYSAIEMEMAEGWEYSAESLEAALAQVIAELERRE